MRIYSWQNILSPHQVPIFDHMHSVGHNVTIVTQEHLSIERRRMGWKPAYPHFAETVTTSSLFQCLHRLRTTSPSAIHVFGGIRTSFLISFILSLYCVLTGRRFFFISEAPDTRGLLSGLRLIKYMFEYYTVGRFVQGVFCIGNHAREWFSRARYPDYLLLDFAYTSGRQDLTQGSQVSVAQDELESSLVGLVGRLDNDKGADIFLEAIVQLPDVHAVIVGDGPLRSQLERRVRSTGAEDRVDFLGFVQHDQVSQIISQLDLLVLPSRKEGWGVVVNEALEMGVGAVCSSACGAACLASTESGVSVFNCGDVRDLISEIKGRLSVKKRGRSSSRYAEFARLISTQRVCEYTLEAMALRLSGRMVPRAPWIGCKG